MLLLSHSTTSVRLSPHQDGTCSPDEGSCGSWLAVPYFVSFVVLSSFVVLKMLIAVLLENYLVALARDANVLQAPTAPPHPGSTPLTLATAPSLGAA